MLVVTDQPASAVCTVMAVTQELQDSSVKLLIVFLQARGLTVYFGVSMQQKLKLGFRFKCVADFYFI